MHCAEHSPTKTDEGIRSCDGQRAMLRSNPAYFPLPVMLILLRSTCYVFFFVRHGCFCYLSHRRNVYLYVKTPPNWKQRNKHTCLAHLAVQLFLSFLRVLGPHTTGELWTLLSSSASLCQRCDCFGSPEPNDEVQCSVIFWRVFLDWFVLFHEASLGSPIAQVIYGCRRRFFTRLFL